MVPVSQTVGKSADLEMKGAEMAFGHCYVWLWV